VDNVRLTGNIEITQIHDFSEVSTTKVYHYRIGISINDLGVVVMTIAEAVYSFNFLYGHVVSANKIMCMRYGPVLPFVSFVARMR
jgi:hypothetical protein